MESVAAKHISRRDFLIGITAFLFGFFLSDISVFIKSRFESVKDRVLCNGKLVIAYTFDDGPHEVPGNESRTNRVIDTLNSKGVVATFFVEHSRIDSIVGQEILMNMNKGGHEIALHGADPAEHHRHHQDTPSLKDKLITMKDIISKTTGQTAMFVRPPGGWGGWTNGTEYDKAQLIQIYDDVSLTRYTGDGTDGANSWGIEVNTEEFWPEIQKKIDEAKKNCSAEKLVILSHDLREWDEIHLAEIIDEIRERGNSAGVGVVFRTMREL